MKLTHRRPGEDRTLATDLSFADGFLSKRLGLMGRAPLEEGEALVFRFDEVDDRQVHSMFVRGTIDVLWLEHERVTARETMPPWRLGRRAAGDTIVELPGGGASGVETGDIVEMS